jgi:membrane-bound lytic murein transglycosylase A
MTLPCLRIAPVLALALFASACVRIIPEPGRPTPVAPTGETALTSRLQPGPPVGSLDIGRDDAEAAIASFRESCPRLVARTDASGLTSGADWQPACNAAATWQSGHAVRFFMQHFETARVGTGEAFSTGYYEPQIAGSRVRRLGYDVPVYAMPPDLVRAKEGDAQPLANGRMPLGRYDAQGRFIAYHTRAEIEDGALTGRGLEIAWATDPVEFFFLQVQGSGRLAAPDGSVMRIGYGGQNGHPYTGIGGVMRERGLLGNGPGQYSGSMQGIMQYVRENPEAGRALMRENASWVFFRELTGDGPLGALGVPVRRESSVAADPKFVPLGAPVWLDLDRNDADGLWIAQDTGGAIKGANRFDTFWGAGEDARRIAGGFQGQGKALLLLPRGTLQRLGRK